jgi:alkylation response protein AidB-like acyl-CoA dehydrogenase
VDFDLSEDQVALRDAARDLLDKLAPPERVRQADGFDRDLWAAMVDQGWLDTESLGLGTVETAVLLEQTGRHVAPVPFLQTTLAIAALRRAGEDGLVEQLTTGERIGTIAWHDDPVVYGDRADVVVRATTGGVTVTELDAAGRPERQAAMDLTRTLAWVDATRPNRRIGGADDVQALLDDAAVGHSAEMLGAAERILEMSTEYAKDRVQFGKPIGSFQAVKHRCADMLVDVEAMRSAVYWAAWCLGAHDEDRSVAASTAKIWCADAAKRVMASGLQVHGGVGFTWEHDLHLFLKRSQLDQVSFGSATCLRDRLRRLLEQRVAAGRYVL